MVNLFHLLILCNTAEVYNYRYTELNQAPPPSQQTNKSFLLQTSVYYSTYMLFWSI